MAAITGATNATPIVVTSVAHGLTTGNHVAIIGVGGNVAANGNWRVTVVDADTFSLDTSHGSGTYSSGGTWSSPVTLTSIAAASYTAPIIITSTAHGLTTGARVRVEGAANTAATGTWKATVVDADHFSLDGSIGNASAITGITAAVPSFPTLGGVDEWCAAYAYRDIGTTANMLSIDFIWEGGDDNPSVALRWSNSALTGMFASVGTTYGVRLTELINNTGFNVVGGTIPSVSTGDSCTLTIHDDGATVTATFTNHTTLSTLTCSITSATGVANTKVAFGWLTFDNEPSYAALSPITHVSAAGVYTMEFGTIDGHVPTATFTPP